MGKLYTKILLRYINIKILACTCRIIIDSDYVHVDVTVKIYYIVFFPNFTKENGSPDILYYSGLTFLDDSRQT